MKRRTKTEPWEITEGEVVHILGISLISISVIFWLLFQMCDELIVQYPDSCKKMEQCIRMMGEGRKHHCVPLIVRCSAEKNALKEKGQ
jgi:hypothetical protein